ncbi:GAF domain-containing protein [Reichenbachiella sp. MSK19-1]|uniref:sensor histidine kinase n=1 Tax=Reichenbachiella sp. MSK19-1 TaxID=1897631 RepID=UPI001314285B|nr:GAF domain-containing protein [Reichenbachiella sp. MSK19-1]
MRGLHLTDYKIQSKAVYRSLLLGHTAIAFLLLLTDIFVDLKSGPLWLYSGYFVLCCSATIHGYRSDEQIKSTRALTPFLILVMIELTFFNYPASYNTIVFWMCFVPLVALIAQGIRASQLWVVIVFLSYVGNSFYIHWIAGEAYAIEVYIIPTAIGGIIFFSGLLISIYVLYNLLGYAYKSSVEKNEELIALKNNLQAKTTILEDYHAAMMDLTRKNLEKKGNTVMIEEVCQVLNRLLNLSRVSIWFYNLDKTKLQRQFLLDNGKVYREEVSLAVIDSPKYFYALEHKPFITAPLAQTHEDTSELTKGYLKPHNIKSMLDCPIYEDRSVIGVICCENKKYVRNWSAEDALIVQSLGDYLSTQYKNEQILQLMNQLKTQNIALHEQRDEISSMNKELHTLNQKLIETNGSLESTVTQRTQELITQNNQLKEYAFVNSHMLRAPLSNILGLSNLIKLNPAFSKDPELIHALYQSTKNLDEIVRKISATLEDGSNLTRKDIDYIINEQFKKSDTD